LGTPINPQWEHVLLTFKGNEHKFSGVVAQATKDTIDVDIELIDLVASAKEVAHVSNVIDVEDLEIVTPIFYKHEGKFIVLAGADKVIATKQAAKPKADGSPITVKGRMLSSVALKGVRVLKAQPPAEQVRPATPFNPPRLNTPHRAGAYNSDSQPRTYAGKPTPRKY
jgi:hypothetical protein